MCTYMYIWKHRTAFRKNCFSFAFSPYYTKCEAMDEWCWNHLGACWKGGQWGFGAEQKDQNCMPSWCRWFLSTALQILPSRLGSRVSIFSNQWLTSPWRNLLLSLGSLNLREFSRRRSSDPALWMAFTPQSSSSWRSFNRETGLVLDQMIFPGVPTSPSPSWFWYDLVGYFFMICSD